MLKKQLRAPLGAKYAYKFFAKQLHFSVRTRDNQLPYNRFAIIVGKSVDKKAVIRNKVKRMMSSCLQTTPLPLSGKDILFVAHKAAVLLSKETLCSEIEKTITQKKSII